MLRTYKDLIVWQKSYELTLNIYKIVKKFPGEEKYGIAVQMQRCAVSIPSNIAEGYGRKYTQEYIHFLNIAYGSCCELETQLMLSKDLGFIIDSEYNNIIEAHNDVERLLSALIRSLKNK